MTDREENNSRPRSENQRIGKELYNQDRNRNQYRAGDRDSSQREWDSGNYFHTGPSERGAQDRDNNRNYNRGGSSNSSYNQGQNAHLNDHYGSRENSAYRNERNYINHGDNNSSDNNRYRGNVGGSASGNRNGMPTYGGDKYREHPGGESRYKEDDYRYGSGSHNWYKEGRYNPDNDRNDRNNREDSGFFGRIKNTWNDIMHSDDPDYRSNSSNNERQSDRISSRERHGSEQYRDRDRGSRYDNGYDRSRDRGFEGGPRWSDEVDSGEDNYYNDTDRNQRYRR